MSFISKVLNFSKTLLLLTLLSGAGAWAAQVQYELLKTFAPPDGTSPRGNLVQGAGGSLYGTTFGGTFRVGSVFKVTTNGDLSTIAYFNGANGAWPHPLTPGNDGNLYGTCGGGVAGNFFQVTPR